MDLVLICYMLVLSGVSLHLTYRIRNKHEKIGFLFPFILLFLIISLLCFSFLLLSPVGCSHTLGMIFGLLYGPFLFVSARRYLKIKTPLVFTVLHFLSFFILLVFYLLVLIHPDAIFLNEREFKILLYISVFISCFLYSLYFLNLVNQRRNRLDYILRIMAGFSILMFAYSVFVIVDMYSIFEYGKIFREGRLPNLDLLLKSLLLSGLFYVLIREVFRFFSSDEAHFEMEKEEDHSVEIPEELKKILPSNLLREYQKSFEELIYHKQYFLNSDAGLDHLAGELKIQSYQITHLVNHIYNMGLPELMNRMRVNYACRLLKENQEWTMLSVAEAAGFTSETSFYRNFRIYKGLTPRQYQTFIREKEG